MDQKNGVNTYNYFRRVLYYPDNYCLVVDENGELKRKNLNFEFSFEVLC